MARVRRGGSRSSSRPPAPGSRALLATLLDHRADAAPDALDAVGAAARELLRWAWDADLEAFAESGIEAVRQTFATAPRECEALLRRVLDPARMADAATARCRA